MMDSIISITYGWLSVEYNITGLHPSSSLPFCVINNVLRVIEGKLALC